MGVEADVKMKYVVRHCDETYDDGTRLFDFLRELTANGLLVEPVRVNRDRRLGQLVCVADSMLRNKSGHDRFFNRRKFRQTHLPSLCRKYAVEAEIWTSCGEVGYDEHYIVDYSGKIIKQEDMETLAWCELDVKKPTAEQKAWNLRWGKWAIPLDAEYEAVKEFRRRCRAEERAIQKKFDAMIAKKYKPGEEISTDDFFLGQCGFTQC